MERENENSTGESSHTHQNPCDQSASVNHQIPSLDKTENGTESTARLKLSNEQST